MSDYPSYASAYITMYIAKQLLNTMKTTSLLFTASYTTNTTNNDDIVKILPTTSTVAVYIFKRGSATIVSTVGLEGRGYNTVSI